MKSQKKKFYRVYLDRPGCGWEEFVKATNVRSAIKRACEKQGCTNDSVVGERVSGDYLVKRDIIKQLERERTEAIDKLARDYINGVTAIVNEYKIKIDNV